MKIKAEASGLTIGVDNAITEALVSGKWGIRLSFSGEELNNRYEVVLSVDEARNFVENIQKSIDSINEIKGQYEFK